MQEVSGYFCLFVKPMPCKHLTPTVPGQLTTLRSYLKQTKSCQNFSLNAHFHTAQMKSLLNSSAWIEGNK